MPHTRLTVYGPPSVDVEDFALAFPCHGIGKSAVLWERVRDPDIEDLLRHSLPDGCWYEVGLGNAWPGRFVFHTRWVNVSLTRFLRLVFQLHVRRGWIRIEATLVGEVARWTKERFEAEEVLDALAPLSASPGGGG